MKDEKRAGHAVRLKKIVSAKGEKFLIKVEASNKADEYLKYEELRNEIWNFPEDNLPGSRNMMCENFLHEGSSLFIAAYREAFPGEFMEDRDHLVGFSYGFVGVKDKEKAFKSLDNIWFYSQYTGIKPGFEGRGLGILIKEFQREQLRDVFGIFTVTCTYDPLTGVNAYRNIHHFGMDVLEYRMDTYGEFGGILNRSDVPSDRFFVTWDLRRKAPRPEYNLESLLEGRTRIIRVEYRKCRGQTRPLEMEVVGNVSRSLGGKFLLVQIPRDFYTMLRETDLPDQQVRRIPLVWRMKTREAFQSLFRRGYRIIDFRTVTSPKVENFYVLINEKTSSLDSSGKERRNE
jgi:predicted GNAT superfamily acetyltransferase